MRTSRLLFQTSMASKETARKSIKSLALSVYFKQPELGMTDYEILSRASCFLLGVDPPKLKAGVGPYEHLKESEEARKTREFQHRKGYTPAEGGRRIMDLGWLEFVPREHRPKVHIVASSHVLSPFLWKNYYPQDWLSKVKQEHCKFSLEVYDPNRPLEPLAKLGINSKPYHHPEGRDVSLVHFEEEKSSLNLLQKLGVEILYMRNSDKLYRKGEPMHFDGMVVSEPNAADGSEYDSQTASHDNKNTENEDLRVFYPYKETGSLSFHTEDRFFASTPKPLPEGLCGAPVLDADGDLCGTVEGIVPIDHKNERLAGTAAFMPSYVMANFIEYVERGMIQQMMPKDLFDMVVSAKRTNSVGGGGNARQDETGTAQEQDEGLESAYEATLKELKKRCSDKEMEAIMSTVKAESDEVLKIMNKEGGDMDEILARVRAKNMQAMVHDQYTKSKREKKD